MACLNCEVELSGIETWNLMICFYASRRKPDKFMFNTEFAADNTLVSSVPRIGHRDITEIKYGDPKFGRQIYGMVGQFGRWIGQKFSACCFS